ncbi:dTDP-glucose 4,6-dehydratase [Lentilactobacillus kefiri]|uniref:dTDP-glucose 4,6-dehydratase n=1 Tax=Lentilactobacillus kefiri TaxID=33962 RepID=UPI000D65AA76|nr:dTDP-glucose 4,6-dehydratase [Lentilactobacillus kefiri]QGV24127.1 dTDP-glucose 4,6-dehydratase [Lentilactobacillus kefiri]
MNILVTGGAGFIGANFIHYLLENYPEDRIVNFDKLTYAGNLANLADVEGNSQYYFVKGDIADQSAVDSVFSAWQIEAVVNFAAESHVDRSILNPNVFICSNYVGVSTLLNAVKRFWVHKFVQISTDEVYGSTPSGNLFTETTPLNPSSPYSATKAGADLLALSYFKTYGLNVSITRSANNYGPLQFPEKLIPLIVTNGLLGKSLPVYGDGKNVRDWLNVADNCRAINAVLRRGKAGQIYNIAAHNYVENIQIVKKIVERLKVDDSKISYVTDRPANDQLYAIDDSKIHHDLGWQPEIDFDEGINQTIDWYVNHEQWWRPLLSGVRNR